MDDSKKLLELCRELADLLDDSLADKSGWDIPALIEPLVNQVHELSRACGYLHAPVEWHPEVGGRGLWQAWTYDGLDIRYDHAMPHLEWWKRAKIMVATWVHGLENKPPPPQPYLGIRLDMEARTISRDGFDVPPIKLTPLQWQAVRLMLAAEGESVPVERFKPPHYDGSVNALREALRKLGETLFSIDVSATERKLVSVR